MQQAFDEVVARVARLVPAQTSFNRLLTQYHGHPIAVHIPNGVLPVAILFTFLSIIFRMESLAIAARYNMLFVFISMPIVIFTGLVDWINQFKGRMTKVFRVKIICAIIVTLTSFILTLWWFIQPEVFQAGYRSVTLFALINLVDLVASVIAGLYGGKLVFRKS